MVMFVWGLGVSLELYPEQAPAAWIFGWILMGATVVWFFYRGSIRVYDFDTDRDLLRIIRLQPIGKRISHHSLRALDQVEVKQCRYRHRYWYRVRLVWRSGALHRLNTDGWHNRADACTIAHRIADFVGTSYTFTDHPGGFF